MIKPRLAIGTCGSIAFTTTESGQVQAATRFRDEDGAVGRGVHVVRPVSVGCMVIRC